MRYLRVRRSLYTVHYTPYTIRSTVNYILQKYSCLLSIIFCSARITSFNKTMIVVLHVRMSLYTHLVFVGLLEFRIIQRKISLDCIYIWERLIRKFYSDTFVGSGILNPGVCFAEIMACSMTQTHSMINILICRLVNSKKVKLTRLLYPQVLSNPVDINRNCLSVRHDAISSCH